MWIDYIKFISKTQQVKQMKTLTFLGYTSNPQNIFWFIIQDGQGELKGFNCNGVGMQLEESKTPRGPYRKLHIDELTDFPEVRKFINEKLKN